MAFVPFTFVHFALILLAIGIVAVGHLTAVLFLLRSWRRGRPRPVDQIDRQTARWDNHFKTAVSIFIALISVISAVIAWRVASADLEIGDSDFAGLSANIRAAETCILNNIGVYNEFRAYTDFVHQEELSNLLWEESQKAEGETRAELERQSRYAWNLATLYSNYFSRRYLDQIEQQEQLVAEPSRLTRLEEYRQAVPCPERHTRQTPGYNLQRALDESWAESAQTANLDPFPHFAKADHLRLHTNRLVSLLIILSISIWFFTIAEGTRRNLKYSLAVAGLLLMLLGVAGAFLMELWKLLL